MIKNRPHLQREFMSNQMTNCPICADLVFRSDINWIKSKNAYGCTECRRRYKSK